MFKGDDYFINGFYGVEFNIIHKLSYENDVKLMYLIRYSWGIVHKKFDIELQGKCQLIYTFRSLS